MKNNNIMTDLCQSEPQNQENLSYPDGFASSPTIDWFDFTIKIKPEQKQALPDDRIVRLNERLSVSPSDEILFLKSSLAKYFGGGAPRPFGKYGYKSSLSILGSGLILWNEDRPEMGVHVSLSSTSLSRFAQTSGKTIYDLLADMADWGAIATRIDLALDTDAVTLDTVIDAYQSDLVVTKTRKWGETKSGERGDEKIGRTFYIGSPKGRRFTRFYDKAAEQGVQGDWTRCEVVFKQEHAITAMMHILGGQDPRSLILSSIDFRLHDNLEINRRSRLDWWQTWVGVCSTVKFPIVKPAAAIADSIAWVLKQVVPTLAWINIYMGGRQWLWSEMLEAVDKIPEWKLALLPDHRFRYDEEQGAA